MKTYSVAEIKKILMLHDKWVRGEGGGKGAYLRGADLQGAYLRGAKYGKDDESELLTNYYTIGPIGSRSDYLQIFQTNKRIEMKTGCFTGSIDEFEKQVISTHGDTQHAQDYLAAITFIRAKSQIN